MVTYTTEFFKTEKNDTGPLTTQDFHWTTYYPELSAIFIYLDMFCTTTK